MKTRRAFLLLTGLFLTAGASDSTVRADVAVTETNKQPRHYVYRMTVTPAAEPVPTFRHRLIARDIDLVPGNAATYYYRALLAFKREYETLRKEFVGDDPLGPWYGTGDGATPIAELPIAKMKRAVDLSTGGATGEELAAAVLRRDCDWQTGIEQVRGPELISFRLEEFQETRQLTRMLCMRIRLAIAEKRYDDAIETMRMSYRLSRDTAGEPLLVCGLIGAAQALNTNGTLIELISAPDSPNLYWALTELPQPMIDMARAARFEFSMSARIFPLIHNTETTTRSPDEWNRLYKDAVRNFARLGPMNGAMNPGTTPTTADFGAMGFALVGYSHAKKRLIEMGLDRERVEQMAVGQVIAIYTERNYRRMADMHEKLWYLPYAESQKRAAEIIQLIDAADPWAGGPDREIVPIIQLLMPALSAVRSASIRLERDMAALRVIEALRMYAAGHAGRLPEKLSQITEVPVPVNPATDQPFTYRLDGAMGVLELPLSDGADLSRRFEITVKTK